MAIAVQCNYSGPGITGLPYSQTFTATGGTAPYQFVKFSGTLPPGLTLAADGTLSGNPSAIGSYSFIIQATDALSAVGLGDCSIIINGPAGALTISPNPPPGYETADYFYKIPAGGGIPPYTFSIIAGDLPDGIFLDDPTTGTLGGLPSAVGLFDFTVEVTDSLGSTASAATSIIVDASPIVPGPCGPPNAFVGVPYSYTYTASGGSPPYSWSATGLPPGLSIDPVTGTVSGTPTTPGRFQFQITVTDSIP